MNEVERVDAFLTKYRKEYEALLAVVRRCVDALKTSRGSEWIVRIYSRGRQNGDELKPAGKVASKIRRYGKVPSLQSYLEMPDIVGVTVVVAYVDRVDDVIGALRELLAHEGLVTTEPERHLNKRGYFATHFVCEREGAAETLRCEVQLKTMLHDAWASKMHDLTYKPSGIFDPRHEALMSLIADNLESVEKQSVILRDLIQESWTIEQEARKGILSEVFDQMLRYNEAVWRASGHPELEALFTEVESVRTSKPTEAELTKLRKSLDELSKDDEERIRHVWPMAARLASVMPTGHHTRLVERYVEQWLDQAGKHLAAGNVTDDKNDTSKISATEITAVPLVFYVLGDLERAIEYAHEIATGDRWARLSKERRNTAKFNWANFIVEREYHSPTLDEGVRVQLQREVSESIALLADDPVCESQHRDALGLCCIAFAETPTAVLAGIDHCLAARLLEKEEVAVASAYAHLNTRLGWRRYFALEARARGTAA